MKLSIVIPVYNSESYISLCLDSILNQNVSQEDYEIIAINDESSDGSLVVLESYKEKHANITIFSQKNGGASAARNKGIELASGDYIYFVDSDDYIADNTLDFLMSLLKDNIDLLGFKRVHTKKLCLKSSSTNLNEIEQSDIIDGISFIEKKGFRDEVGWYLVKRSFLKNENIFFMEGTMLEDISFNLQLFAKAKKIIFIPLDVYRYVSRVNSVMTNRGSAHFMKIINSYERVLLELQAFILKLKSINSEAAKRLNLKKEGYHFFLFMRLLRSNLPVAKINEKIKYYKNVGLYPVLYSDERKLWRVFKVKFLVFIFNTKLFMFFFLRLYRFFSKRAV